ncbi:MAG TPA: GAF domain-containing sensor histidine kinase [Thermoanaerobaculia bacterium]|nr:GAF domain-containing sensor histidine kinase [Thermoanaerobaculia bacterium]
MTLRQMRWLAVGAPLVLVVVMELTRSITLGRHSLASRLLLDSVLVILVAAFSLFVLRVVERMHARLKRQNQELLLLHAAGLDITAELSLDAVLDKVVERARSLIGARYGALSIVNEQGRIVSFLTSGITPDERAKIGPPPVGHGLLGVVLREGQRLRLDDIHRDPRSQGFPPHHPVMRTLLAVPIVGKSPFRGNLYLSEKVGGGEFTADDEETLERFAVQAAIAIDNAHLHQQVKNLAVAEERLRIAHEMHDGIAQVLGYVNTKVQAASEYIRRGRTDEANEQLRELAVAAREAYGDVREAITDLRTLPSQARTISDVLRDYIERWREQTGISTHVTIDSGFAVRPEAELQLIRIVQESLANVRKHAKASSVVFDLRKSGARLVATVADDGVGFDPSARTRGDFPRFGLSTMRERAESIGGVLTIDSAPGRGTTIRVEIPLAAA